MKLGIRSTFVADKLKGISMPRGLYLQDRKLEAIVNDINRLHISAVMVESNPIFRQYAIDERSFTHGLHVTKHMDIFNMPRSWQRHKFNLISLNPIRDEFDKEHMSMQMYRLFSDALGMMSDRCVVQFKEPKLFMLSLIMLQTIIGRKYKDILSDNLVVDLPHQMSKLWLYYFDKGER